MNELTRNSGLLAGGLLTLLASAFCWAGSDAEPPPLGKLYEVGGHKMHLYASGNVTGNPGPSVVLEAGTGAFSIDWYLVQQNVARFARVCSYDRAGHAWSELGPRPRTMKQAAHDLHGLLVAAGVNAPYVMVGHSLGGTMVRVFAAMYPNDVAGMVLVDASPDNGPMFINGKTEGPFDAAKPRQVPPARNSIRVDERTLMKPELDGYRQFVELQGKPTIEPPFDRLPVQIQRLRLWAMSLPQSNVTDFNPYRAEESVLLFADRIRTDHPLGAKPLVVLSRKSDDKLHIEGEQSFLNLSGNSAFAVSDFPVHEIQLAQPGLVVEAIRAVIESVEERGPVRLAGPEQGH